MTARHLALGEAGEELAACFLAEKGFRIVERRVRCRRGELDIVATCGGEWVFVEVKTRGSKRMGSAAEAMTARKAGRMALAVREYLWRHGLDSAPVRCDLVTVDFGADGRPDINHYPAAIPMR